MIKIENYLGEIEINQKYFSELVGRAVTEAFGIAGMSSGTGSVKSILNLFTGGRDKANGVEVKYEGRELVLGIHIIINYGVNIRTIVDSVTNKVSYTVENATGLAVRRVDVYVDGMKNDA